MQSAQQNYLLGAGKTATAVGIQEVDACRDQPVPVVSAVPGKAVFAGLIGRICQSGDQVAPQIVDLNMDIGGFTEFEAQSGFGIEGIRETGMQAKIFYQGTCLISGRCCGNNDIVKFTLAGVVHILNFVEIFDAVNHITIDIRIFVHRRCTAITGNQLVINNDKPTVFCCAAVEIEAEVVGFALGDPGQSDFAVAWNGVEFLEFDGEGEILYAGEVEPICIMTVPVILVGNR